MNTMSSVWRSVVWAGLLASAASELVEVPFASQEPPPCRRDAPFTLAEVEELVKNPGIPEAFTRLQIESCGVISSSTSRRQGVCGRSGPATR